MNKEQQSNDCNPQVQGDENSASDIEDEILLERGQNAFYIIGVISVLAIGLYLWQFASQGLAKEQETWGQFGDFLGGFLNPAIGLVTIYLVLVNVRMQRKELRNSLNELKNSNFALTRQIKAAEFQSFQQTFFTWLNSYQDIVNSVNFIDGEGINRTGRDGLFAAQRRFMGSDDIAREVIAHGLPTGDHYRVFYKTGYVDSIFEENVKAAILKQWTLVYGRTAHHIGSMFRTLYRLLLWIDEQPTTVINKDQKWQYISIARAQISDVELSYLFFNGFTEKGKKFVELINKYALFDNLDPERDYLLTFMSELSDSPYLPEAYNSDIARALTQENITQP